MPAVCQFEVAEIECGVTAIGRCVSCGRAFCAGHQARAGRTSFVDQCMPCMVTIAASNAAAEREYNSRYGLNYLETKAAGDLRAAGVPTVNIYTIHEERQHRSFGRSRRARVENVVADRLGSRHLPLGLWRAGV